jgi:hypothetical protein
MRRICLGSATAGNRAPTSPHWNKALAAARSEIVRLRSDLTNKAGYAATLELVLRQRTQIIDDLVGKLEQSRAQCQRLDAEAERLAEMVRLS